MSLAIILLPIVVQSQDASKKSVSGVIVEYMALKDALVKSDTKKASMAAKNLSKQMKKGFGDSEMKAVKMIAESDNLVGQREAFQVVTAGVLEWSKNNDAGSTLYIQHCPMSFGNKGADWLSLSEEVLNPYYGDAMLRCGSVKGKID